MMAGTYFHDAPVIERRRVGQDRLGLCVCEELLEIGIVERGIQRKLMSVLVEKIAARLSDTYNLKIGTVKIAAEETAGVAVDEAGDGNTKRGRTRWLLGSIVLRTDARASGQSSESN